MKNAIYTLCFALLAGCQSGPIKVVDMPGERRVSPADTVRVRLSDADMQRLDPLLMFGQERQAETGPIWRQVFVGVDADPLFTIESAELRYSIEAAGFVGRFTYSIKGALSLSGTERAIHASGTRAFAMNINSAMRQAVELGIVDAAQQCRAIISAKGE